MTCICHASKFYLRSGPQVFDKVCSSFQVFFYAWLKIVDTRRVSNRTDVLSDHWYSILDLFEHKSFDLSNILKPAFFLSIIPNHSTWPLTLCLFVFISACQLLSIIFRKSWVIHPKVLKWMSGVDWGAKTFVDDTHLNTGTNKLSSSSIFLWKIGNKKDWE